MFALGFWEIILIVLAIIIFVRPSDMPSFMRKLGKFYAKITKLYDEIIDIKDRFLEESKEDGKKSDNNEK